jgi:hypothetical protein
LRINYQNHLTNEASMAAHLTMLCNVIAALIPGNGRDKSKNGAARSEGSGGASGSSTGNSAASGTVLEELNRARNRNAESIATLEGRIEQIERRYRELAGGCCWTNELYI